jgi:hypothetical protein
MFQYAIGRSLSKKYETSLYLDTSELIRRGGSDERAFALDNYSIVECLPPETLRVALSIYRRPPFRQIFKEWPLKLIREQQAYKLQKMSHLNTQHGVYLDGYWQCFDYFDEIRNHLLNEFRPRNELSVQSKLILSRIVANPSVGLHIRRGDYVSNMAANNNHGVCHNSYYENALSFIQEKIGKFHLFVFSDDLDWARRNLKCSMPTIFVSSDGGNLPDHEELYLMSKCSHLITANSTFSWWAAWLNCHISKIVISPKSWLRDSRVDVTDLIPKSWVRL